MSRFILSIFLFFFTNTVFAQVNCPGGVQFDTVLTVNDGEQGFDLMLNGVGKKQVFIFNVLYGALYLEEPSNDSATIIASDQVKSGIIHAMRDIDEGQLKDLWDGEFERLCEDQCDELLPAHETFISYVRDVQKHERLYLTMFQDRFEFTINQNEFFDPIYSPGYANLLQRSLIGDDPADKSLKKGMLGKSICK